MIKKVSDIIADILEERGIRHVFGIVGSGNAHIFDSITQKGYTEIVCVHHEQAAVMAMQTYFRTTGKVSACILTTGAGSTNAVTGVVSAWMDSIPGVMISGNENSKFTLEDNRLRIWGIQGYDSIEMVRRVTKYVSRLMEPKAIRAELERCFNIAGSGRPGPVWLDVPMNVQAAPVETEQLIAESSLPEVPPVKAPAPPADRLKVTKDPVTAAKTTVDKLMAAKRPVIWLGHGIRLAGAVHLIEPLLERLGVPALVSWAGIDMVDSNHPLVYGRAGIYGQRSANFVLQNSDFVLAIGTRLAIPQVGYDLTELARAAELAVVDIDYSEATKHSSRVTNAFVMDAKAFIDSVIEFSGPLKSVSRTDWVHFCDELRARFPWVGQEHPDKDGFINSYRFMERLEKYFKPEQIVVTDMGTALLSGHQVLKFKKGQRLMTSTGLGEMGYGLPAAIGASFGTNHGEVICLNCDGGMMMNLQELQTVVHHKLPIKLIIFNNEGYLMIKHTQKALFQGRYSGTDEKSGVTCPNFTSVAKAFEIPAFQIKTWEDMERVMPQVQAIQGPVICEVFMHPEQPFVPKLGLAPQKDGSIISPPLEDLSPFLPREVIKEVMRVGMHPKSEKINA